MTKLLIGLVIISVLFSCTSTHEKVINNLHTKRQLFDDFVTAAFQDEKLKANLEKFVIPDQLTELTQEKLANLGLGRVLYVILSRRDCEQAEEYSLEIIFDGDSHLVYYSCGRPHFIPGGYSESGLIESWGIDQYWALWINNDFMG